MTGLQGTTYKTLGKLIISTLVLAVLVGIQAQWSAYAAPGNSPSNAPSNIPQAGTWEQQAPYPTRFSINGVDMVTPTEAWAVAYTDILHSTDGGATWEHQSRPGADNLYSVDFFDSQHGIAMGNTTLYTSNGGATWSESPDAFGYDVEMADANLAFITDHRVAGFLRTTDGGATWTFRTMPTNITTIQCFDSLNCVAASPDGVYHSYDAGLNWTFIAGQGGTYVSTHFISHDQGWIISGDTANRTTDGGTTWQPQTLPPGSWIYDFMFTDSNNGWGVGDNMVRTTNGGTTWQEVPLPPQSLPLWDVDFADAQHGIAGGDAFLATDSVIITSSDGGATWDTRTDGTTNETLDMVALDSDHAWASHTYGGKISRTTNGGDTWQVAEVGEQYILLGAIDMADNLHGWTVGFETTYYEGRIYHTDDGGVTWQFQYDPAAYVLRGVAALDSQTAIIVGGGNGSGAIRHRTTDGGATWHELNVPIASFFFDVFFLDSRTGWMVGGNGDIVKSIDGGDTWVVQPNPAQYTLSNIHFSDPNNGWAGGNYGTLVHTTNGGATWILQNPQIPEYTHVLDVSATSPLRGWIAGYGGGADSRPFVKYTTDGGATWINHTPAVGRHDSFGALAFINDDYGWAAGAGGIFRHTGSGQGTPTATRTPTVTRTPTLTATITQAPPTITQVAATSTSTFVPPTVTPAQPTGTTTTMPTGTATATALPSTGTPVPSATLQACNITFTDVEPGSTFYPYIQCLACRGIITGYEDNTFRPQNNVTRGQAAKIISNAAGYNETIPPTQQTFADVPSGSTFWVFIERVALHSAISGYPCGGEGEPCPGTYFRPQNDVTRGQLAKIDATAAGYNDEIPPTQQTFTDVPPDSTFWVFVERVALHNVVNGYADGTYRPTNPITRGQAAKIVTNTFFPGCPTQPR